MNYYSVPLKIMSIGPFKLLKLLMQGSIEVSLFYQDALLIWITYTKGYLILTQDGPKIMPKCLQVGLRKTNDYTSLMIYGRAGLTLSLQRNSQMKVLISLDSTHFF